MSVRISKLLVALTALTLSAALTMHVEAARGGNDVLLLSADPFESVPRVDGEDGGVDAQLRSASCATDERGHAQAR